MIRLFFLLNPVRSLFCLFQSHAVYPSGHAPDIDIFQTSVVLQVFPQPSNGLPTNAGEFLRMWQSLLDEPPRHRGAKRSNPVRLRHPRIPVDGFLGRRGEAITGFV